MPQTKEERNEKRRARRARATPEEKAKTAARQKEWQKDHREEINAKANARNATAEGKAKVKKLNRARTLRKNPDAREEDHFVGTDAERYKHYMNLSKTVEIDDRAVPSCPDTPCLIGWKARKAHGGYPVMSLSGVGEVYVHRWLWANAHGPIPKDLFITHLCNNGARGCLTLSHLSADTPTQNAADKVHNRTTLRTLSPPTVRGIRWLHSLGYAGQAELARMYGTTASVVQSIIEGRTYKEVQVNL